MLWILFLSCKGPPPPAPDNLEELCQYLFAHVDDPGTEELENGLENLHDWLLAVDPDPPEDAEEGQINLVDATDGYTVNNIALEAINNLDEVERTVGEKQMGAAVAFIHNFSVMEVARASFIDYWPTVSGSDYAVYEREFSEDPSCILEQTCSWIEYDNYSISSWAGMLTVESDLHGQVRWVSTDYGDMIIQRTWMKTPAIITPDSLGLEVQAQYFVSAIIPTDNGTIRSNATWIETEYGVLPVSEDWALNQIVDTMVDQEEKIEVWLAGE